MSSTKLIPEDAPLIEADTIENGRIKLTKFPCEKSKGAPNTSPLKTPSS